MATTSLLSNDAASNAARAVFDEIKQARNVPDVNNFWKALAHDPDTLRRVWDSVKAVMAPGALDPMVKEMIYVAVSAAHGCGYCVHSHTAAARRAGMTPEMHAELLAVIGLASQTNALATALQVPVDPMFMVPETDPRG